MVTPTNLITFKDVDGRLIHKMDMAYYLSGIWMCDKSPSQAHWWIGNDGAFTCKYCGDTKPINGNRRKYGK